MQMHALPMEGADTLTISRVGNGWIVRRYQRESPLVAGEETRVAETPEKLAELVRGWATDHVEVKGKEEVR